MNAADNKTFYQIKEISCYLEMEDLFQFIYELNDPLNTNAVFLNRKYSSFNLTMKKHCFLLILLCNLHDCFLSFFKHDQKDH